MPRALRKEYCGAKYHITARGNGRNAIFLRQDDYMRFIDQLAIALDKDSIVLFAYAVLSNHYHLLVETPRGNLHSFLQRLNTAYSLYWRYKHQKPGHVFQGRYGAKLVAGDNYLLALTRYIHLNPVKGKQWENVSPEERYRHLRAYKWSSYHSYVCGDGAQSFVNLRWLKLMGGRSIRANRKLYRAYVEGMVLQNDDQLLDALNVSRYALGDKSFVDEVEDTLKDTRKGTGLDADVIWPQQKYISLDLIDEVLCNTYKITKELLQLHGNATGEAKQIALEFACKYGGLSQRAAGERYGEISCAAVGQQRKQLRAKLKCDKMLRNRFQQLAIRLNV